ncbi:hypothetical protein DCCM_4509 [Desulfocucumis palustris]|uniref:Uncharacterized protein n=1 Tax=Desulfocucumis palustris TaxID=1898651 RepID=A0A2L2XM39_9FIRM|nr:hypothetical protein [Desulfocucumis palustris]GBF35386.1 hypothetical protein DCCM_4509 [Desulfocucumis palustris]
MINPYSEALQKTGMARKEKPDSPERTNSTEIGGHTTFGGMSPIILAGEPGKAGRKF